MSDHPEDDQPANKVLAPPGIHANRLRQEAGNPREIAFASQWAKEHEYSDLLRFLFLVNAMSDEEGAVPIYDPARFNAYARFPVGEITDRDRIIAATLMQWLGSNIGMSFLHIALERAGYKLEKMRS